MTVKKWLKRARVIDVEINQLLIAKKEAYEYALGCGVDTSKESVQGSGGNGSEDKFIKVADYEMMIDKKIDLLLTVKNEIIKAVDEVEDSTYRTLLIAYYVNCRTWEQVAEEIGYGVRHIYRIHEEALKKIGEVLVLS